MKAIFSDRHIIFRDLVREMRESAGLSQAELAERIHRTQPFISKVESGERLLDLLELQEICAAVGMSLAEFVTKFEAATKNDA